MIKKIVISHYWLFTKISIICNKQIVDAIAPCLTVSQPLQLMGYMMCIIKADRCNPHNLILLVPITEAVFNIFTSSLN